MKSIPIYLLIFSLSLFLPACSEVSPSPTETPKAEPIVLRVGALDDDYQLNPEDPGRVSVGMISVNTNIFDTLIRMDTNFQLHPMLAESWEYLEENGTWRFFLRQDVTFHNDQPFTAQAVVETMNVTGQGGGPVGVRSGATARPRNARQRARIMRGIWSALSGVRATSGKSDTAGGARISNSTILDFALW